MLYQRKRVSDMSDIGEPGPLPRELQGSMIDADLARIGEIIAEEFASEYEGQGFFPVPDPPSVVTEVSRLQARLALNAAGLLASAEAAVAAADMATQIYWADASVFHRDHPLIAAIAGVLGLSDEQVDDLFAAAAAIV
jgi:hypothetical protein